MALVEQKNGPRISERGKLQEEQARSMGRPIFIVGTGRSGTTLLSFILDSHPNIAVGRESMVMRAISDLYSDSSGEWGNELRNTVLKGWYERYGVSRKEFNIYVRRFLDGFFGNYALRQGKGRWGEKTPRHSIYCKLIYEIFPDAQFVHIVRDPRAVCASRKKWKNKTMREAAAQWQQWNDMITDFSETVPEGVYYRIKYEDLVQRPEFAIRPLIEFLGEPWNDNLLKHEEVVTERFIAPSYTDPERHAWHRRICAGKAIVEGSPTNDPARPIDTKSINQWMKRLRKRDISMIQKVTAEGMKRYGYKKAAGLTPLVGKVVLGDK